MNKEVEILKIGSIIPRVVGGKINTCYDDYTDAETIMVVFNGGPLFDHYVAILKEKCGDRYKYLKTDQSIVGTPDIQPDRFSKFDKKSNDIMEQILTTYTIVPGPLQKMIPFSNGVYMIAYTDNKKAEYLKTYIENTPKNRVFFEKEVEKALDIEPNSLKIIAIKDFYWPIGTHYYEPLNTQKYKNRSEFIRDAQHPEKCLLVVGEAVSRRQGWTEGALESVHAVLNKKWINNNDCSN